LGLGFFDKSDKVDAKVLSQAARLLAEQDRCVPSLAAQELRDLSRVIDQLKQDSADYQKRLEGMEPDSASYKLCELSSQTLTDLAKKHEKAWTEMARQDPETWRRYKLAKTVPSVGHVTARIASVELPPNLDRVSMRKIAGYAGLAPRRHESGESLLPPAIYGGNARLRTGLFMAATNSVYRTKRHLPFYENLRSRKHVLVRTEGGRHLKAITAVMRKLLSNIVAVIKRNEPWRPAPPACPHVPACKQAMT
jgi:transposase